MVASGDGASEHPSLLVRLARLLWVGCQVYGLYLVGFPPPRVGEPQPADPSDDWSRVRVPDDLSGLDRLGPAPRREG